jgi:myo-inositol-1(or 4)-monophosphatase
MWLVDPLCGTLNYAVRNMLVAVNVALRVGSDITAAASADPFTEEVFWTDGERANVRSDGVDEELTPVGCRNSIRGHYQRLCGDLS